MQRTVKVMVASCSTGNSANTCWLHSIIHIPNCYRCVLDGVGIAIMSVLSPERESLALEWELGVLRNLRTYVIMQWNSGTPIPCLCPSGSSTNN